MVRQLHRQTGVADPEGVTATRCVGIARLCTAVEQTGCLQHIAFRAQVGRVELYPAVRVRLIDRHPCRTAVIAHLQQGHFAKRVRLTVPAVQYPHLQRTGLEDARAGRSDFVAFHRLLIGLRPQQVAPALGQSVEIEFHLPRTVRHALEPVCLLRLRNLFPHLHPLPRKARSAHPVLQRHGHRRIAQHETMRPLGPQLLAHLLLTVRRTGRHHHIGFAAHRRRVDLDPARTVGHRRQHRHVIAVVRPAFQAHRRTDLGLTGRTVHQLHLQLAHPEAVPARRRLDLTRHPRLEGLALDDVTAPRSQTVQIERCEAAAVRRGRCPPGIGAVGRPFVGVQFDARNARVGHVVYQFDHQTGTADPEHLASRSRIDRACLGLPVHQARCLQHIALGAQFRRIELHPALAIGAIASRPHQTAVRRHLLQRHVAPRVRLPVASVEQLYLQHSDLEHGRPGRRNRAALHHLLIGLRLQQIAPTLGQPVKIEFHLARTVRPALEPVNLLRLRNLFPHLHPLPRKARSAHPVLQRHGHRRIAQHETMRPLGPQLLAHLLLTVRRTGRHHHIGFAAHRRRVDLDPARTVGHRRQHRHVIAVVRPAFEHHRSTDLRLTGRTVHHLHLQLAHPETVPARLADQRAAHHQPERLTLHNVIAPRTQTFQIEQRNPFAIRRALGAPGLRSVRCALVGVQFHSGKSRFGHVVRQLHRQRCRKQQTRKEEHQKQQQRKEKSSTNEQTERHDTPRIHAGFTDASDARAAPRRQEKTFA